MVKYLLLLHGYTQNGSIMKDKITKVLSKKIMDEYTVIFPDGPYFIDENKLGWWKLESPEMFTKEHTYEDWEKAINTVEQSINHVNSDDELTVIAFSQETIVLEIMMSLSKIKPSKIILFSPSGIMDMNICESSLRSDTTIPILVMMGEKENIFGIDENHYQKYTTFDSYEVKIHKQGHVIPSQSNDKEIIKKFIV